MDSRLNRLEVEVRQLRDAIEELLNKSRGRDEIGSPGKPVTALYLRSETNQKVARITFDAAATDVKVEEV